MMGHLKLAPQWLKHLLIAQMPGVWCEHEGQGPEPVKWTLFRTQVIRRFLQIEAWQQRVSWGWGCCWNVLLTLRSLFSLTGGAVGSCSDTALTPSWSEQNEGTAYAVRWLNLTENSRPLSLGSWPCQLASRPLGVVDTEHGPPLGSATRSPSPGFSPLCPATQSPEGRTTNTLNATW